MEKNLPKAMAILGLLLALGMSVAAFVLGVQAKHAAAGKQTITVKGLAEKPVKADMAEWTVSVVLTAPDVAAGLKKLAEKRPVLEDFLDKQGLAKNTWQAGAEEVYPHYEDEPLPNGNMRSVQRGFEAKQSIHVTTRELLKVAGAAERFVQLRAQGQPVNAEPPLFLVSQLEEIKMSLISDATKNARKRAEEFVKTDSAKVGVMRSATQGAFYILPNSANVDVGDYGGTYDKSTIDKLARVVVTVEYSIEQ